jgi:hypothetical protein
VSDPPVAKPVVKSSDLRTKLLRYLATHTSLTWYEMDSPNPNSSFRREVAAGVQARLIDEALWTMVSEGLVFLEARDFNALANWRWNLTERGQRCATGTGFDADDPASYVAKLKAKAPSFADPAEFYMREALRAYGVGCGAAAAVMIGVAAEAEFQAVGDASLKWLKGRERQGFSKIFKDPTLRYATKLDALRKLLLAKRKALPLDLRDGLEATFYTLADLLRISRNEAGHPSGHAPNRDEAHNLLVLFGTYVARLEALRAFFLTRQRARHP